MTPVLAALSALLAAAPASAMVEFSWDPSTAPVLIGSPFTVAGTARYPENLDLLGPEVDQKTGPFEILGVEVGPPEFEEGREKRRLVLKASVFALGNQTLPELRWTMRQGGIDAAVITSPPFTLTVRPPRPGLRDTGDIRDIKGPFRAVIWPWALALLILLAAALGGAWALWNKFRRPPALEPSRAPADARTPEERAIAELEALEAEDIPVKEFYDRLSDILRLYFERRALVPSAMSMTTHDLQRRLILTEADPKARSMTKSLLDRCDLAKFARFLPEEAESFRDVATAKNIVRMLDPRVPAEGPVK